MCLWAIKYIRNPYFHATECFIRRQQPPSGSKYFPLLENPSSLPLLQDSSLTPTSNEHNQNIIHVKWLQNRSTIQKVRKLHFTSELCIREIIYKSIIGITNAKQTGGKVACMGS